MLLWPSPSCLDAAGVDRDQVVADLGLAVLGLGLDEVHLRGADEAGDEQVDGLVVELQRGVDLHQLAEVHHRDPVAHRHGLDLVVGHVDRGDAEVGLQLGDVGAGLHAHLGVEVGQRLVHAEHLRVADDRAAHGDALALTTGERLGLALEELGQAEDLGGVRDALAALLGRHLGHLQGEGHVVGDGHVGVQRVVLEHHRDVAVLRRDVGDVAVADEDLAVVDLLEPREHAQRGGLAASRGPDEDHELAVGDLEVERGDRGLVVARVPPLCLVESHCCHVDVLPSPAGTCRTIRREVTSVTLWAVSSGASHP